jgi:hypothetical protein
VKSRLVWVAVALAVVLALATAVLWLTGSPLWPYRLVAKPAQALADDSVIEVEARAATPQVHQGDLFTYVVEVHYNPTRVAEIDRSSIDRGLSLKPFEIRGIQDSQLNLSGGTRVLRREYQLQLVNGTVDVLYEFLGFPLRYKLRNSEGFSEKNAVPEPVYVAPRLPADASSVELRPPTGHVVDPSRRYLPWLLSALGLALAGAGAADLAWRTLPQWRATAQPKRKLGDDDTLVVAYRSLQRGPLEDGEPRQLLYRMEHTLRLALARRGKLGWLDELDAEQAPPEMRPALAAFLQRVQGRRGANGVSRQDAEQALGELEAILICCFGTEEVQAWRG